MTSRSHGIGRWVSGIVSVCAILWLGAGTMAGQIQPGSVDRSADGVWQNAADRQVAREVVRPDLGGPYVVVRFDKFAFDVIASRAPGETAAGDATVEEILTLPMPDGSFPRFKVQRSPILAPELAAAFPEIVTFRGQGIDDPTATTRFGWTRLGFHAIVLSASGTVMIDPLQPGQLEYYASYNKADVRRQGPPFICLVGDDVDRAQLRLENAFPLTNGDTKRTYKLALAATGEYTVKAGGSQAAALARMTTTMNRVNGIYERDLSVTMTMATGTVADPMALIYKDGAADPYTDSDGVAMLGENQTNIDAVVGNANYDIGHVFSTGGGGIASVRSPCSATAKARGVTGSSNPTGDAFDVDYVAHEMGHQFGGNHTFNGTSGNCGGGNRSTNHAYEVGSGSTIMGYAGICPAEDLQPNSNDQFHVESIDEITAFLTSGGGSTCGTASATGNTLPAVNAGSSYTIPQQTPFTLTATGSDANGDSLTYQWDQFDLGASSSSVATASTDDGTRPLFRSYSQTSSPSRTFPSLTYILNNANVPPTTYTCSLGSCLTGETLPATNRTMTFQALVRDNRSGRGAVATSSTQITVTTAAGPFQVTSPTSAVSWAAGAQTVTWNVAGTTASPVSAANVKITLSTNGGSTFPYVLAASTANDGTEAVTIPNVATSSARIRIEAVGNVFFDVSNTNFTITGTPSAPTVTQQPANKAVGAGGFASFTAAADGSPAPTVQWQVSANAGATWSDLALATSTTYALTTTTADNGKRYHAVFTNASGSKTSDPATLTVYGPIAASPTSLKFGVVKAGAGSVITSQTPTQTVTIAFSGAASSWTAATTDTWLTITGGSGSAAGQFTVAVGNPIDVIGGSTSLSGTISVTSTTAPNSPLAIPVTLTVVRPTSNAPPFGSFDTPAAGSTGLQGSFAVTGWALDDIGVNKVEIWRDLVTGEPASHAYTTDPSHPAYGKVYIADALFVKGSRTDVEAGYSGYPFAYRSGWGYLLLSWGLHGQGNGTYTLYAYAYDIEGRSAALGSKTIGVDNAHATKPFGAIDTPSYGGSVSGGFWNFGWALTPNATPTCTITNGKVTMNIDSGPFFTVNYGDLRTDIAASFPGFSNGNNSGGAYYVDSTQYTNDVHTIGWLVYDSCNRGDGVGSRFFSVLNGSADQAARPPVVTNYAGWAVRAAAARAADISGSPVEVRQLDGAEQTVWPNASGTRVVEVAQDGRVEIQLPALGGETYAGYQDVGQMRRGLPAGSSLDADRGVFYWQPGPGFLGSYDLVFGPGTGGGSMLRTRIVVGPPVRMAIDTPADGAQVGTPFTLAGWAVDLAARERAGIDAVHIWAYPVGGGAPIWLGAAAHGDPRPDVGAIYGQALQESAYNLVVDHLAAGEYDVVVYVRRAKTGTFEATQTVRIRVR